MGFNLETYLLNSCLRYDINTALSINHDLIIHTPSAMFVYKMLDLHSPHH